jgi:hypothetical protein
MDMLLYCQGDFAEATLAMDIPLSVTLRKHFQRIAYSKIQDYLTEKPE